MCIERERGEREREREEREREREKVDFKSREVNCLKECALALSEQRMGKQSQITDEWFCLLIVVIYSGMVTKHC